MKISTRGRYGTRIMLELALRHGEGPLKVKDLASLHDLSAKYLENLLAILKAAGLVSAVHGSRGGYVLARPPSETPLRRVYEALEGPLSIVHCAGDPAGCPRSRLCAVRDVWTEIQEQVGRTLDSITLAGLVERHRGKERSLQPAYEI